MPVQNCHRRLVTIQYAVFEIAGGTPVEHPRRVILHLGFLKVKILRLIIRDPDLKAAIVVDVRASRASARRPAKIAYK